MGGDEEHKDEGGTEEVVTKVETEAPPAEEPPKVEEPPKTEEPPAAATESETKTD